MTREQRAYMLQGWSDGVPPPSSFSISFCWQRFVFMYDTLPVENIIGILWRWGIRIFEGHVIKNNEITDDEKKEKEKEREGERDNHLSTHRKGGHITRWGEDDREHTWDWGGDVLDRNKFFMLPFFVGDGTSLLSGYESSGKYQLHDKKSLNFTGRNTQRLILPFGRTIHSEEEEVRFVEILYESFHWITWRKARKQSKSERERKIPWRVKSWGKWI